MSARRLVATFVAVGALCVPGLARANGRFPAASQLVVDPSNGAHYLLRTTFGLLQSTDAGGSWRWICESAAGYGGVLDPAVTIAKDGVLLGGLGNGITASTDLGCDWTIDGGPAKGEFVVDLAISKVDPARVVGITSTGSLSGGTKNILVESHDGGRTFTQSGVAIPSDFTSETLDLVPADAQRVYVSGFVDTADRVSALEVSTDDGATWTRRPIALGGRDAAYIGAIDPTNADRLYVRLDGDNGDVLVESDDAGVTWRQRYTTTGDMLGLALSPDGASIAIGGPQDGILVASTTDFAFTKASAIEAECLTWTSAGLLACASEFPDGFTIGISADRGATFSPLYHLADLAPLDCPASSSFGQSCPDQWPAIAQTLGVGSDVDAGTTPPPASSGSGGCAFGVEPSWSWASIAVPLALVTALRGRSRRRWRARSEAARSSARNGAGAPSPRASTSPSPR